MKLDFYKRDYGVFNMHDLWKFLALLLMFVDHFGLYISYHEEYRMVGRLSFPIFAVIFGYHFKNKINFLLPLYGLPIVLLNFHYNMNPYLLNILYSFFFGSIFMEIYDKSATKLGDKIVFISLMLFLNFLFKDIFEYGSFIFFFMLITKQEKIVKLFSFFIVFAFYFFDQITIFSFNKINIVIFGILLFITAFFLYNYKLSKLVNKNNFITKILSFISRYSLEIYVIQACIFRIVFMNSL